MRELVFATIALITAAALPAAELPVVEPEEMGFSSSRLGKVSEFAQRNVDQGKHAGMVTMIARHGQIVHFETHGRYGIDDDRPMQKDTLFRIFSMTKPVTSVALMILYEEGRFHLHDPVAKYLPEMANVKLYRDGELQDPPSAITIEQLLTHTAGLSYGWLPDDPVDKLYREAQIWRAGDLDEFVARIASLPLRFAPGERFHYSVATDLAGAVVERISGQDLESFFQERIFGPLGMDDTSFVVPAEKLERVATMHGWNAQEQALTLLPAEYNPELDKVTLFSGGGGLVSTAMDYMVFCEMLRQGGSFSGARILGPKTVQFMRLPKLTQAVRNEGAMEYPAQHLYPGQNYGYGFGVITHPGQSQVISSVGEYSWGGAADTKFWIDPVEDLTVVMMTQLLGAPWETRYELKVATYQSLMQLGKWQPGPGWMPE